MSRPTAAIFDLDRTLVDGSSAPVFQRHLAEHGLGQKIDMPLLDAMFGLYNRVGESRIVMMLTRLTAARAARGWPVADVRKAADAAADDLEAMVPPFAKQELASHREAGRTLVMATTSPESLVSPLAARLGIDVVIATRWDDDGEVYTGEMIGRFVWGRDKLLAVKEWAADAGVALDASYAYSDSYYDAPLLAEVGHGVAVNPDPRLRVVAGIQGWPIRHFDVPEGVVKIAGREIQDLMRPFNQPWLLPNARFEISGIENIPETGGAILCGNHRSYFDSAALNLVIAKSGRSGRFLGKKEVFDAPIIGPLARAAGGIRVDRGTGSDEPLLAAARALQAGEIIAMMPQGTIPRGPAFFDPVLKARWGAARLAAMARVPVIPVGLWGTEKVWPRSARLPRFDVVDPPLVQVRVGPPVELGYEDVEQDTERLMAAIVELLPEEARVPREPTPEELALTYPPGYRGDPTREAERRPGSDT